MRGGHDRFPGQDAPRGGSEHADRQPAGPGLQAARREERQPLGGGFGPAGGKAAGLRQRLLLSLCVFGINGRLPHRILVEI